MVVCPPVFCKGGGIIMSCLLFPFLADCNGSGMLKKGDTLLVGIAGVRFKLEAFF